MPKISLRSYFQRIDKLIDNGDYDEAIQHSRYLLSLYPKCVSAYRSLAKALLERRNNPEARDIFTRVLAVYPDDFISHVGLSIIYENEGNLDSSIWHMELAYDVEPSNPVLTEELRRLFGRRDGIQPPKIRMTRGALIRMYARGELYQQAISECQGVLKEDPRRLDIQLILAQMQYLSGSLLESSDICSKILEGSPYCFEANRLMIEIIPRTSQNIAVTLYKSRLDEVDPYFKFVTSAEMNSSDIPDDAIMVEFLDEDNMPALAAGQNWTESKITPSEPQREAPPDRENTPLPAIPTENPVRASAALSGVMSLSSDSDELEKSHDEFIKKEMDSQDTDANAVYNDRELPDWLLKAGWEPSKAASSEKLDNLIPSTENEKVEPQNAGSNPLPDWMNNAQPPREFAHPAENIDEPTMEIASGEPPAALTNNEETPKKEAALESESQLELPEVQTPIPAQGEAGEKMTTDSNNRNEDEWLNQLRNDPAPKGDQNDLPDWLKDFESENEQPLEENMEIPEWLKSLEPAEPVEGASPENKPPEEVAPASESAETPEEPEPAITSTSYVFTKMLSESEARAANLEPEPMNEEPLASPAEPAAPVIQEPVQSASSSGLPAWVRNILKKSAPTPPPPAEPNPVETVPSEKPVFGEEATPLSTEEAVQPPLSEKTVSTPETESFPVEATVLGEEPIHELSADIPEEGAISPDTSAELLDWLRGLGETEEQLPETAPAEEVAAMPEAEETPFAEEPVDRLGSFINASEEITLPSPVEPVAEIKPLNIPAPEPVSEIPAKPIPESVSAEPETAWVEEIAHEEETPVSEEIPAVESTAENVEEPVLAGTLPGTEAEALPSAEEPAVQVPEVSGVEEVLPVAEESTGEVAETEPLVSPQAEASVPEHDVLSAAREALLAGDSSTALMHYAQALQNETRIPALIESLRAATAEHSENTDLWQLLGDAYVRTSQFGDAFAAYDKAEAALLKS